MLTYLRYTLAAVCFAASVGCLALWEWTAARPYSAHFATFIWYPVTIDVQLCDGEAKVALLRRFRRTFSGPPRTFDTGELESVYLTQFERTIQSQGYFANGFRSVYFPLWYPALIFALAGVGVLRFRRKFSIRSALVCLTVVAALLGMAVAL